MTIKINPKSVLKSLTIFISTLLILNFIDIYLRLYKNYDSEIVYLTYFFNFDNERSFPTMYSVLALFITAIILFIISLNKKHTKVNSYMWLGLSLIFLFLSADELLTFHEKLGYTLQETFNTSGMFWYAWLIPYSIFVILLPIIYAKFLLGLKKKIRILFIVSGAVFVTGAVGIELIQSKIASETNERDLFYYILYSMEEFLEMFGIVLFIYTLTYYIKLEFKKIIIEI